MRHFSPHSVTFLQNRSSRELPCPDVSPDWNSHITYDEGLQATKMPDAHFLKDNLESAPSPSLLPKPRFVPCHPPCKRSGGHPRDKQGDTGTKLGDPVGNEQPEPARVKPRVENFKRCTLRCGKIPHSLLT